jgi:radical SAM protein with 4Fe4S-binding SPASM domain
VQSDAVPNNPLRIDDRKMAFFAYSPCENKGAEQKAHVLFHASGSSWIKVNDTGLEIARHLGRGRSDQEAALYLKEKYGISSEVALRDVLLVRDELFHHGFLKPKPIPWPSRSPTLNSVFLHLTSRCNLSCRHCYVKGSQIDYDKDLPGTLVLRIIDELADQGGRAVTLSGGEPLLHPEIKKILQHAAPKVQIGLSTNGTLIDREWARFLSDIDVHVQVSIDGSTREIHDSIRGRGAFEKSLKALEYLQSADLGERITLATTVMKQNLDDLPAIISQAERLGVLLVRFMPLRREGMAEREWKAIGSGLTISDSERFYEYTSRLQNNGKSGVDTRCGLSGFLMKMPEEREANDIWCPVGEKLVITVNGDAYPCVLMMEDEYRLGNAFHDSLEKMIQSDVMYRVCRVLSQRRNKIKKCAVCTWRNLCQAGCMGQALDNKGTIWDTDDFCDYRKRAYKEAFDKILALDD